MLAHKVAITLEACHAKEVIEQALARHGTPDITALKELGKSLRCGRFNMANTIDHDGLYRCSCDVQPGEADVGLC